MTSKTQYSGRVLVVGGIGPTGHHVVEFLQKRDTPVRLLVRDRQRAEAMYGADIDALVADVGGELGLAFTAVDAVISTPGSRNLPATLRLVAAAREAGVEHFVLCSGAADSDAAESEAETALRASGLRFTIVRPGDLFDGLTDDPAMIDCQRVAQALVAALSRPEAQGATFELSNARLQAPDADPLFGVRL